MSEVEACFWLALPLAGAQLSQSATGFVDTVMMGLLGSQAIAAGALGATSFTALLLIGTAIVSAVSPLVAEAYGAKQPDRVGPIVRQGLCLCLLLGIPATLLIWNAGPLLSLMGQQPENVALAETYMRAIAPGYLPGLAFAVLRGFVSALSQPRPVIVITACGTLFNIVANYLLMFGKLGLPKLGLAGIGLASTFSLTGMFVALAIFILTQPQFEIYKPFDKPYQFNCKIFWEIVHIGIPIGVLAAVETGLFIVTTFLMGLLGTVTLAAHQIALQTAAITFTVAQGISIATTVRVGQLSGQRDPAGARLAGYIGIGMGILFMGAMGILFWLAPEAIVGLYLNTQDPANAQVVALAKSLLIVAAMFQIADGVQVVAAGALRGVKDTQIPMLIGICAYWGIGLTVGYGLGLKLGFGAVGLWWGLAFGLAAAAAVLTWRFNVKTR